MRSASASHDAFYKDLLSRPQAMAGLLRLLDEPFVGRIDMSAMEMLPAGFVTDDQRRLEADMIWRAPLKRGPWRIHIHLEFQSRPERRMIKRIWRYRRELRRALVVRGERREDEPFEAAIFSLVIYNGLAPWKAPAGMAGLLPPALRGVVPCQEEGGCRVLCLRDIPRDRLKDGGNPFVLAVLLERASTGEEILEVLELAMAHLPGEENASLRRLLFRRMDHGLRRRGIAHEFPDLRRLDKEDEPMFEKRIVGIMKDYRRRALEEGEARGRAEGEARGRAEGEARGRAEGEARGRAEGFADALLTVARNLLREKSAPAFVADVTGLPLADVERLAAEMGV